LDTRTFRCHYHCSSRLRSGSGLHNFELSGMHPQGSASWIPATKHDREPQTITLLVATFAICQGSSRRLSVVRPSATRAWTTRLSLKDSVSSSAKLMNESEKFRKVVGRSRARSTRRVFRTSLFGGSAWRSRGWFVRIVRHLNESFFSISSTAYHV
jgi:hypothetical protein